MIIDKPINTYKEEVLEITQNWNKEFKDEIEFVENGLAALDDIEAFRRKVERVKKSLDVSKKALEEELTELKQSAEKQDKENEEAIVEAVEQFEGARFTVTVSVDASWHASYYREAEEEYYFTLNVRNNLTGVNKEYEGGGSIDVYPRSRSFDSSYVSCEHVLDGVVPQWQIEAVNNAMIKYLTDEENVWWS